MSVTAAVTVWAGILIRKWKQSELSPHGYRWNFKDEGSFLLFWVAQSFLIIFLAIDATLVFLSQNPDPDPDPDPDATLGPST